MEFIIDLRFEDKNYSALVHFVATFVANDNNEAKLFYDELVAGFKREGATFFTAHYYRIDNDQELKERTYEYCEFCRKTATASIQIEQFLVENPDQTKSLADNLTQKLFNGQKATALIGKEYNIPVKVLDKATRNPISGEFYYFTVEHLIPKA